MIIQSSSKYGAVIIKCTCTNDFQDKVYGKGMRVANLCKQKSTKIAKRCTICKKEHD